MRYAQGGRNGKTVDLHAGREVLLSGGVINSPQLLQLAGIGNPELLSKLGIATRQALPGVGENLRDHYTPRFTARVRNSDTFNERVHGLRLMAEAVKWVFKRPSVLGIASTVCYAFARSNPALSGRCCQAAMVMPGSVSRVL